MSERRAKDEVLVLKAALISLVDAVALTYGGCGAEILRESYLAGEEIFNTTKHSPDKKTIIEATWRVMWMSPEKLANHIVVVVNPNLGENN
ncbi:MAG: hypothetical protein SAL07_25520 [Oscillatoria sp. PMC 1051.18]|nr:hypothetical protein [Oscillatoria sp. PMC 1050.18]MEC5033268.1 hypothetical protein [Oscillatoria sp. PMC 1051.18]